MLHTIQVRQLLNVFESDVSFWKFEFSTILLLFSGNLQNSDLISFADRLDFFDNFFAFRLLISTSSCRIMSFLCRNREIMKICL